MSLAGQDIVVLDLETAKSADDCRRCSQPEEAHGFHGKCDTKAGQMQGARFAKIGWDSKPALGLSIGCYYAYSDSRMHWFDVYTLEETVRGFVETQPLLVSFNGIAFDFPLMRAVLRQEAERQIGHDMLSTERERRMAIHPLTILCNAFHALCTTSYDILAEIWRVDPGRKFEHGLNSLDAIAQANGFGAKLSSGAQAPRDWRDGHYAKVLNYCQDDVLKTKELLEQIVETGVIARGDALPIVLPRPEGDFYGLKV